MALFGFIKKKKLITGEFFGQLLLVEDHTTDQHFFSGQRIFKATGTALRFEMPVLGPGPTQQQIEFYRNVEDNYHLLAEKLAPFIEAEWGKWRPGFRIKDFLREFTPDFLSIPDFNVRPVQWELCFTTIHDRHHFINIYLIGDNPVAILVDG